MYTEHFGLKALPFENVPDPLFFFDGGDYHRVLRRMSDSLSAGRGLLAIAGPIGAGKTTLSQKLMADLSEMIRLVWLAEPPSTAMDLLRFLSWDIGAGEGSSSRVFILRDIRRRLQEIHSGGRRCLMIIDESHLMTDDVLEGVRLLNNLEEGAYKLIQVILLGQQELIERLSRPDMEAFRQRVAGLEVLGRMDAADLRDYVAHRLEVAGCSRPLFTEQALEAITLSTGGVPRKTNSLCDRSLRIAYEEQKGTVDTEQVHKAATDLGMGRATMHYLLKVRESAPDSAPRPPLPPGEGPGGETDGTAPSPMTGRRALSAQEEPEEPGAPGLALPFLLLLGSIGAFASSLLFFCGRAAGGPSASCLKSLLERLF